MADLENVVEHLYDCLAASKPENMLVFVRKGIVGDVIAILKEQEAREPHYTTLRYLVNGMEVAVRHPECPRCIENGLVLWDAEIERGQAYCKRCGQAVKWDV